MFEEDPEDIYYVFKEASKYTDLLDHFISQIPPAAVRLDMQVKKLEHLEDKVGIHLEGSSRLDVDYVLFTPSLGVLKWAVAKKDFFEPTLPLEKVRAIESLGFGAAGKIVMR